MDNVRRALWVPEGGGGESNVCSEASDGEVLLRGQISIPLFVNLNKAHKRVNGKENVGSFVKDCT